MLAEGHREFTADLLIQILRQMIADDQCRGVVVSAARNVRILPF
jgi:hypothetical protein